jgi:hypothetical protein
MLAGRGIHAGGGKERQADRQKQAKIEVVRER